MDEMDLSQFKDIFISESKEHLVSLNSGLIELEKNPANKDIINQIFRAAHTLKGMAATMGYEKITSLSHKMEDALDLLKKDVIRVNASIIGLIFKCFDALEKLVEEIENNQESKTDVGELIVLLSELLEKKEIEPALFEKKTVKETRENLVHEAAPETFNPENEKKFDEPKKLKTTSSSIRINISYLDTMMNLVGEMVISKSQLEQIGQKHKIEELTGALQQFDRIAIELQEAVLKTRMVTLSQIFDRFPRMVRDVSLKLQKDIEFDIFGADIEIDRMIIDEINEPLVHLLRNAVDHGLESADERKKSGKPPKGKVTLSASRERGYIAIEVKDDGKGLDPSLIKRKAVEKGILLESEAATLTDEETYLLICDPRFSTAEKISDISGRGVGMDVVKTVIESVNGSLFINSKKGAGSSFTIHLPLTMAIISALLVNIGKAKYAIPLNNITEIFPFSLQNIKKIEGKEVIMLRNEVIPLIRLEDRFKKIFRSSSTPPIENAGFILRVEALNRTAGLLVNDFIGRKEIVIKSLTGLMKKAKGFSGATILGDGSVVLIIDVGTWI